MKDADCWASSEARREYTSEVLSLLRPAVVETRRRGFESPEAPFLGSWKSGVEWLEREAAETPPKSDPERVRDIQMSVRDLNQASGMKWVLQNQSLRVEFTDTEGIDRSLPVHTQSSLGGIAKEVKGLSQFTGVREGLLWRFLLTGEEPGPVSPATVTRIDRVHDVPGLGRRRLNSVELCLHTHRIPSHEFRRFSVTVRKTWGREYTDSGHDVMRVVEDLGGCPVSFAHGQRKRFWTEVAEGARERGIRNAHGTWFGWRGAETAFRRVKREESPET